MSKKVVIAVAAASAVLAGTVAVAVTSTGGAATPPVGDTGPSPVALGAPTGAPATVGEVTWSSGPWVAPTGTGAAALLPSSRTHGPLTDLGDGRWVDYLPTPPAAAIAAMRAGVLVAAAPPVLRESVAADVLDDPPAIPATGPGLNGSDDWAIPADWPGGPWPDSSTSVLGAVAALDSTVEPLRATVDIYHLVTAPQAPPTTWLTTYTLVYRQRQWLLQPPDGSYPPGIADPPPSYTVRGPLPGEGA